MKPVFGPQLPNELDWPKWMRVAAEETKVREIKGPGMNPRIAEYYAHTRGAPPDDDDVPWCSAFACFCIEAAGFKSTRSRAARSWLAWGTPLIKPRFGCVMIFARGDGTAKGHVGFYAGNVSERRCWLLGGNQGNRVGYQQRDLPKLLGMRWPAPDTDL